MSHPYVDKKSGLAMLAGNQKIYVTLLKKYFAGDLYEKAMAGVASDDVGQAQTALHTLKGATGNLHLKALHEKSKDLELIIKNEGRLPTPNEMAELTDAQEKTLAEIQIIVDDPSKLM